LEEVVENNFSQNKETVEWQPPSEENKEYYSKLHNTLATRASMAIQKEDLKFYMMRPLPSPPIHQTGKLPPVRSKPRPSTSPVPAISLPITTTSNNNTNNNNNQKLIKDKSNETKVKSMPQLKSSQNQPPPVPKRVHPSESLSTSVPITSTIHQYLGIKTTARNMNDTQRPKAISMVKPKLPPKRLHQPTTNNKTNNSNRNNGTTSASSPPSSSLPLLSSPHSITTTATVRLINPVEPHTTETQHSQK
jgi:hypothetical protein